MKSQLALLLFALALAPLRATAEGGAGELLIATSASIPPFAIAGDDSGIVVDIMRAALTEQGYRVNFTYAPNQRLAMELARGKVDGVYNLPLGLIENVHYSEPVIVYLNVAITLQAEALDISSIEDLATLRVTGFQNATVFLGDDFALMAQSNPRYTEVSHQRSQLAQLFQGHTDVIVLDWSIFTYLRQILADSMDTSTPIRVHQLLPPMERFAAFVDPGVRDDFNSGLRALHETSQYEAIVRHYLPDPLPTYITGQRK